MSCQRRLRQIRALIAPARPPAPAGPGISANRARQAGGRCLGPHHVHPQRGAVAQVLRTASPPAALPRCATAPARAAAAAHPASMRQAQPGGCRCASGGECKAGVGLQVARLATTIWRVVVRCSSRSMASFGRSSAPPGGGAAPPAPGAAAPSRPPAFRCPLPEEPRAVDAGPLERQRQLLCAAAVQQAQRIHLRRGAPDLQQRVLCASRQRLRPARGGRCDGDGRREPLLQPPVGAGAAA